MHGPMQGQFLSRIMNWWRNFRIALREYQRRNLAELHYWGTKRIARQLGGAAPRSLTMEKRDDEEHGHRGLAYQTVGERGRAAADFESANRLSSQTRRGIS